MIWQDVRRVNFKNSLFVGKYGNHYLNDQYKKIKQALRIIVANRFLDFCHFVYVYLSPRSLNSLLNDPFVLICSFV